MRTLVTRALLFCLCILVQSVALADDSVRRTLWVSNFVEKIKAKPDHLLYLSEAQRNYRTAKVNRAFDEYLVNLPQRIATDAFPGKKVPLGFDYLRDSVPGRPQTIKKVREYYNEDPSAFYRLGEKSYDVLIKRDDELTDRELGYKNILNSEVQAGILPGANADIKTLFNGAPGVAMNAIAERLNKKNAAEVKKILSSNEELKTFILNEFGTMDAALQTVNKSVAERYDRINNMSEQIGQLTADADIKKAKEKREGEIAEGRAGVYLASKLLGLSDQEAGRIVDVGGNASIDIAVAVVNISENGLSLAATGNIVGAAFAVAGLFDKSPDVNSIRHQQIVSMLAHISEQLTVINNKLDVVDEKMTLVIAGIEELKRGQAESTASIVARIDALDRQIGDTFRDIRSDHISLLAQDFKVAERICQNLFPEGGAFVDSQQSSPGIQATNCLSQSETYALLTSRESAFNYKDFNLNSGALSTLQGLPDVYDFLGITPQITSRLGIDPNLSTFKVKNLHSSDFIGLPHPDALADGARAFIDLQDRVPEMPYANEKSILYSFLDQAERLARVFDLAYEADLDVNGKYTTQPYLTALSDLKDAIRDAEPAYFAYAETHDQALERSRGGQIWCFNGKSPPDENVCKRKISLLTDIDLHTPRHPDLEHLLGYFAGAQLDVINILSRTERNPEIATHGPNGVVSTVRACARYWPKIIIEKDLSGQGLQKEFYTFTKNEQCIDLISKPSANEAEARNDLATQFTVFLGARMVDRDQFSPPPGQAWDDPTQALAISNKILAARRGNFGNWLFSEFTNNHLPKLSAAVEALDRSVFAWEFLERIGRGGCFSVIPSKVELFYPSKQGLLLKGAEVRSLLSAGDVMGIINRIKDVETRKVQVKVKGRDVEVVAIGAGNVEDYDSKVCSRYPAALTSILRDLDIRIALLDKQLVLKRKK
jgi:hypothetical protein